MPERIPMRYTVALQGFSDFERSALASFFRLAQERAPAYEQAASPAESDFIIADADHASDVAALRDTNRLQDTVFIGARAPAGAVAWLPRPIEPTHIVRELDLLLEQRLASLDEPPDTRLGQLRPERPDGRRRPARQRRAGGRRQPHRAQVPADAPAGPGLPRAPGARRRAGDGAAGVAGLLAGVSRRRAGPARQHGRSGRVPAHQAAQGAPRRHRAGRADGDRPQRLDGPRARRPRRLRRLPDQAADGRRVSAALRQLDPASSATPAPASV